MRPFNKKFSVFDPNLQIGADTKKTAEGDNNIQKAEFEQVIRSSGQTPGASISISSLTQTGGLATAVTAAPHGFINGQWVDIFGVDAVPYELLVYNGIQQATVTAPDTFTFPILPGTPSPATGTIGVYTSQIDKAIANYTASQFAWKEAAGSAPDVYVLERVGIPTLTAPSAYTEGSLFQFEVVNTNTGASTMEIPVLGTKNIKDSVGNNPAVGWLPAGEVVTLRYDGTNLVLLERSPAYSIDGPTLLQYSLQSTGGWAFTGFSVTITSNTGLVMVFASIPSVLVVNTSAAAIGLQSNLVAGAPMAGTFVAFDVLDSTHRGITIPKLIPVAKGVSQSFQVVVNIDTTNGSVTFENMTLTAWVIGG